MQRFQIKAREQFSPAHQSLSEQPKKDLGFVQRANGEVA